MLNIVPWPISQRESRVQLRPLRVGFVADNVALEQGTIRLLLCSSVSIIAPMFHTHSLNKHRQQTILAIETVVK
jgi:hypothetical protein